MVTGAAGESLDQQRKRVMKVFAPESGSATILHLEEKESHVKEVTRTLFSLSLVDVY